MEFVDLRTGYQLMGFGDFESARFATEQLCGKGFKVAYLNEACHVQELEVREFTRRFEEADGPKYQNYHYKMWEQAKAKAAESLQTAVEVLEKKSSLRAKYIVVVNTKAKKESIRMMK